MPFSSIIRPATRVRAAVAMTALTLAAACGSQGDKSDAALRNDLSLAGKPGTAQQVVSPAEMTPGTTSTGAPVAGVTGPNGVPTTAVAPTTPTPTPAPQVIERERVVYRDRPTHHHSSEGGSGTYSSGTTTTAAAPQPTVRHSHTQNGAIIGGAAGAALGVATSRDKLKGGLIGAVLGGAAGAVIGNNTGVTHTP